MGSGYHSPVLLFIIADMENNRLTIKINEKDNVAVAIKDLEKGTDIGNGIITRDFIPQAHKIALCDIPEKGEVIRYGVVLGYAKQPICKGDWINEHMLYLPESPSL